MNSGMVKLNYARTIEDRANAHKLGFIRQAIKRGYFKTAAPIFVATPGDVGSLVGGSVSAARGFTGRAGSILGTMVSDSEDDVQLAKLEAEEEQLRSRLRELMSAREDRALRKVLRGRR